MKGSETLEGSKTRTAGLQKAGHIGHMCPYTRGPQRTQRVSGGKREGRKKEGGKEKKGRKREKKREKRKKRKKMRIRL